MIARAEKEVEAKPSDPTPAYQLARVYATYGKKEEAIEWLGKAIGQGYKDIAYLKTDPAFANIREERDFQLLLLQRQNTFSQKAFPIIPFVSPLLEPLSLVIHRAAASYVYSNRWPGVLVARNKKDNGKRRTTARFHSPQHIPPINSANLLAINRPRPRPANSLVSRMSALSNFSKMAARSSLAIRLPVSANRKFHAVVLRISVRRYENLALGSKFDRVVDEIL